MIKYIIIILLFYSCSTSKPVVIVSDASKANPYIAYIPVVKKEPGVISYKLQHSKNNKTWTTVSTFFPKYLPDSNVYQVALPNINTPYFWRIYATMIKGQYVNQSIYINPTK